MVSSPKTSSHQRMPSFRSSLGKSKSNGRLETSPSRAAAIRRGDIQISGPIPITDDYEREVAGPRSTTTTFRTRSDVSQRRAQVSREGSLNDGSVARSYIEGDRPGQAHRAHSQTPPNERSQALEPIDDGSMLEAAGSHHSHASHGSFTGNRVSISATEKPKRKSTGFRAALRRIFGGGKKSGKKLKESEESAEPPVQSSRPEHQSDPGVIQRANQEANPHNLQRSASVPIGEVSRRTPLGSHSPFGNELLTSRDRTFNNRDSMMLEDDGRRPRRTTLPSLLFSPDQAAQYADWTGLAPRPASSHERSSRIIDPADVAIGFAVTSGTNPRRRSRSAGPELRFRDVTSSERPRSLHRRRSDEIRYWRESSFSERPLSPLSSGKRSERPREERVQPQCEPPPQSFNFGPLMRDMGTMKITEAASMDSRVKELEVKVAHLQGVIWKLRGKPAGALLLPGVAKRGDGESSSYSRSPSRLNQRSERSGRFVDEEVSRDSPLGSMTYTDYPETFLETPGRSPDVADKDRPMSLSTATTIRNPGTREGTSSLDESLHSPYLTQEHYKTLIAAIKQERKARRHLEKQVSSLYGLVEDMRQAIYNSINTQSARSPIVYINQASPDHQKQQNFNDEPVPRPTRFAGFDSVAPDDMDEETYILDGYAASEDVFETPMDHTPTTAVSERKEYFLYNVGGSEPTSSQNSPTRQDSMGPGSPELGRGQRTLSLSRLTKVGSQ